jgi:hypothetical protein
MVYQSPLFQRIPEARDDMVTGQRENKGLRFEKMLQSLWEFVREQRRNSLLIQSTNILMLPICQTSF